MTYERVLTDEPAPAGIDTSEQRTPEALPDEQAISLGRRLRSPQTLISFAVAIGIIYFLFSRLNIDFADVWRHVRESNPLLLVLAFVAYYGSFPVRAARWRILLRNAGISRENGHPVPGTVGLSEIYLLSWFVNCVAPAKLGDAYRGYLVKKHAGPSFSRTLGTIFAERLLDVFALVALMIGSGLFVFHGTVPDSLRWWFGAGGLLVVVGIGGLLALMTVGHRIERLLPERARPYYGRLVAGIITSFSRTGLVRVILLTMTIWVLEGTRVLFVARGLGIELSPAESVFVALLASLLTTFPFTPAGLGVVEGGTVIALKLLGVPVAGATAVALVDRGIASYSVLLIGGLVYLLSKHK
jgi:uncharacterized membrane protein YbhN (UPF0104 family)